MLIITRSDRFVGESYTSRYSLNWDEEFDEPMTLDGLRALRDRIVEVVAEEERLAAAGEK